MAWFIFSGDGVCGCQSVSSLQRPCCTQKTISDEGYVEAYGKEMGAQAASSAEARDETVPI